MQVISYQRLIPTIDGGAKVLFDQIEGKDLDKDIIQGNIQVLDLYVYNIGMTGASLSLATAISMLKSLVSVTLLFIVNFVSKKTRGESII